MYPQLFSAGGDQKPAACTTQQHTHLLLYPGWKSNAKRVVTYRIGQLSLTHLDRNIPSIASGTAGFQPSGMHLTNDLSQDVLISITVSSNAGAEELQSKRMLLPNIVSEIKRKNS